MVGSGTWTLGSIWSSSSRADRRILRNRPLKRFDIVVSAAASNANPGLDADDIVWLLDNSHGEIVVVRPGPDDRSSEPTPSQRRASPGIAAEAQRRLPRPWPES
jgi:hypothetical protein